jgi:hypothetical protein
MFRLPGADGGGGDKTQVDNETLTSLAENLKVLSQALVKTQQEAAETKAASEKASKAAVEAQANNIALQAQLNSQTAKRAGGYKFRHLGNELT